MLMGLGWFGEKNQCGQPDAQLADRELVKPFWPALSWRIFSGISWANERRGWQRKPLPLPSQGGHELWPFVVSAIACNWMVCMGIWFISARSRLRGVYGDGFR